ncbi:MAG: PorT family protein [Candidatus Marinimicrobia bacterium]|nr:PorT family protein [Candidatus Neomarinimicrobiota bacterium]
MKKMLMVLMCVLLASAAYAQFDLGIKLGANYSYIQSEEFDYEIYLEQFSDLANITGFVGGAFAVMGFGSLGIQAEALFSVEGLSLPDAFEGDIEGATGDATIQTNYLNAVLMARYNIDLSIVKPFITAGVNVGIPLGESVIEGEIDIENFDLTKLGLAFGAGIQLFDMVDVEIRYVQGITDIYTGETDDTESTFANLIRLSLGLYIF